MYQTRGPKKAYSDTIGAPDLVEVEESPDLSLVHDDPENFDLYEWALEFSKAHSYRSKFSGSSYEWALEFSKAVGFEVERIPLTPEE